MGHDAFTVCTVLTPAVMLELTKQYASAVTHAYILQSRDRRGGAHEGSDHGGSILLTDFETQTSRHFISDPDSSRGKSSVFQEAWLATTDAHIGRGVSERVVSRLQFWLRSTLPNPLLNRRSLLRDAPSEVIQSPLA